MSQCSKSRSEQCAIMQSAKGVVERAFKFRTSDAQVAVIIVLGRPGIGILLLHHTLSIVWPE
eukprot:4645761-Amphidinium_carterae.1